MISLLNKLNLRPHERRLVVLGAIVLFVLVNLWWVWPRFNDWSRTQQELETTRVTLETYQNQIAKVKGIEQRLKELEGDGSVVWDEQHIQLTKTVQEQARASGLRIDKSSAAPGRTTSEFFEEQLLNISVTAKEEELIRFLVTVGSGNSMIRVRDMNLRTDQTRNRLTGTIMLSATYQKRPARAASAPSGTAAVDAAPRAPAAAPRN